MDLRSNADAVRRLSPARRPAGSGSAVPARRRSCSGTGTRPRRCPAAGRRPPNAAVDSGEESATYKVPDTTVPALPAASVVAAESGSPLAAAVTGVSLSVTVNGWVTAVPETGVVEVHDHRPPPGGGAERVQLGAGFGLERGADGDSSASALPAPGTMSPAASTSSARNVARRSRRRPSPAARDQSPAATSSPASAARAGARAG